jgi:hypothetical protein
MAEEGAAAAAVNEVDRADDSSAANQDLEEDNGSTAKRRHPRRSSSMELRKEALREMSQTALKLLGDLEKLDDDAMLATTTEPQTSLPEDEENNYGTTASKNQKQAIKKQQLGCFKLFFLNPSYSLRKQMLVTFGTVSTLTILLIMIVSITATYVAGYHAKEDAMSNAEKLFKTSLGTTARYIAESISPKLMPTDVANIMKEFLLDRFVGYPYVEDDSATPFYSSSENTSIYPIVMKDPFLPMDWDFNGTKGNVNETNYLEHVQNSKRLSWYAAYPRLSTMNSFYFMQGSCNPNATNTASFDYYPNCTDANNDVSTGGVVAPTSVNSQIARKSASLSPLLKSLFEYDQDIKNVGYFFSNAGAGSLVMFPHHETDGKSTYVSIGCDWMRALNPTNPDLGPIASEEEIARCHPNGTVAPSREYNPLERGWCRDQALSPDKFHAVGPYQDAWDPTLWVITAGKAVYDSQTGKFIACILMDTTLGGVRNVLDGVALDEWAEPIVSRWDDGTIITAPKLVDTAPTTIYDPSLETGIDRATFDAIRSLVDFNGQWDPKEAKTAFEVKSFGNDNDSSIIFASPIPPIPSEYDPLYFPQFVSILSISKDDALQQVVDDLGDTIDMQVKNLVIFTSIVGIVGIIIIILVIFGASSYLTGPLRWMSSVGSEIVNEFGSGKDSDIDFERKSSCVYSPNTELDALVKQFTKMIKRFSKLGTAKRADVAQIEIRNEFALCEEFSDLYNSREDGSFPFKYKGATNEVEEDMLGRRLKLNRGRNLRESETNASVYSMNPTTKDFETSVWISPFFWSIVTFIIIPLLVFSLIISVVVLWKISTFAELLEPVKEDFISLYDKYLYSSTALRASLISSLTEEKARDLHVITRYATWLFFGALNTTGSVVDMVGAGAEECKNTPVGETCRWLKDQPCDCDWGWHFDEGKTCTQYEERESRPLQQLFMASQSDDAWPDGTRNYTRSPFATSPEATNWWGNVSELPGSSKGSVADSNYGTSFQRARTASAMAGVLISFYNVLLGELPPGLPGVPNLALMFEADGMAIGFSGCTPFSAGVSPFWSSSEANGAAELQPDLCPIGKHGYDPRCRKWYDDGKNKAINGESILHITSPYVFAGLNGTVAQTGTSAIMNQRTKEYIGQIMLDFVPLTLISLLEVDTKLPKDGFSILATPDSNVVVAPGYNREKADVSIKDIVLQNDDCTSEKQSASCEEVGAIVEMMSAGKSGSATFTRSTSTGRKETVRISYAPVFVKSYNVIDSSNFASGVEQESNLIYSVTLAAPEEPMLEPFHSVKVNTKSDVVISIAVIAALLALALLILVLVAYRVALSLIIPVLHLLKGKC